MILMHLLTFGKYGDIVYSDQPDQDLNKLFEITKQGNHQRAPKFCMFKTIVRFYMVYIFEFCGYITDFLTKEII